MNRSMRSWIWSTRDALKAFLQSFADYRQRFIHRASQLGLMLPFEYEHRAERLLVQNLTPAQKEQYKKDKCFSVTGGETGAVYLIKHGRTMNVWRLGEKGQCVEQLCFHSVELLPTGDNMLAQKFMLEVCETEALSLALSYKPNQNPVGCSPFF